MTEASLSAFLRLFPDEVVRATRAAADAVVVVDDASPNFRSDPSAGLASVAQKIAPLLKTHCRTVIWCYSGDRGNGLEDFELVAILGRWLAIRSVAQVDDEWGRRILVLATPRKESVAVSFTAPAGLTGNRLRELFEKPMGPAPVLFFASKALSQLAADTDGAAALQELVSRGGSVALLIPGADTDSAFSDPGAQVAPFATLGLKVNLVRFECAPKIDAFKLDAFMHATGAVCDCSVPVGAAAETELNRNGAYSGVSPYRPQPFDVRVPWYRCEPNMWIECPVFPAGEGFEQRLREQIGGRSDRDLAQRLDGNGIASFFRASAINPGLDAEYPDHRIYNWPKAPPEERAWLIDGGVATVERRQQIASALATFEPASLSVVGEREFLRVANAEVWSRYGLTSATALDVQNASHTYLADLPRDAPLRHDYAEFSRFVPASLGETLEIGSGYGVLAWTLSTRARQYVCVELDAGMFRGLRRDLGQSGVVADIHRMPFGDARFDSIVANNVIEHFYDPLAGLQEIRRLLKPGGRVLALLPFDALDNQYDLPAHLWKVDEAGLRSGFTAAGFAIDRLEIINLHDLGVPGAFPSCRGFAAMIDAQNLAGESSATVPTTRRQIPRVFARELERAGRVWPSVRELAQFERWTGKRVVAIDANPQDLDEFRHFGADVVAVSGNPSEWPVEARRADLVYAFLTLNPTELPALTAAMKRVLAPSGRVVATFRNRHGLRYMSRLRSYFGSACDLSRLIGVDNTISLADGDGAVDADYVTAEELRGAFAGFGKVDVAIRNLVPDDIGSPVTANYPQEFWRWLSMAAGRFVMVRTSQ